MGVSFLYGATGGKKEKENRSVYVRVTYNDLNWKKTLKMNIQKSEWDFNKKMVKSLASGSRSNERSNYLQSIIDKIDGLKTSYERWLADLKVSGRVDTISLIEFRKECEDIFNGVTNRNKVDRFYLTDLIEKFIKLKEDHNESYNTIRSYKSRLKTIKKFEEEKERRYYSDEVDLDFYNDLKSWSYSKKFKPNTFGGFIRNIKATLRYYRRFGVPINPHIDDPYFRDVKEQVEKVILSEDEIGRIFNFEGSVKLNNVRDIAKVLYYGCMRYSDFLKTFEDGYGSLKIFDKKGVRVWEVKQPKTRSTKPTKTIPLHFHIEKMIEEDSLPKPISSVQFNSLLKELCREVGIVKNVASHDFRRSYVTNSINRGDRPIDVRKLSGHTTWSAFDTYCKNNGIDWDPIA